MTEGKPVELVRDRRGIYGMGAISAAERSLVRRASILTVELERLEAKFATAL